MHLIPLCIGLNNATTSLVCHAAPLIWPLNTSTYRHMFLCTVSQVTRHPCHSFSLHCFACSIFCIPPDPLAPGRWFLLEAGHGANQIALFYSYFCFLLVGPGRDAGAYTGKRPSRLLRPVTPLRPVICLEPRRPFTQTLCYSIISICMRLTAAV